MSAVNFNRFGPPTLEHEFQSELNQARICPGSCADSFCFLGAIVSQRIPGAARSILFSNASFSVNHRPPNPLSSSPFIITWVILQRRLSRQARTFGSTGL